LNFDIVSDFELRISSLWWICSTTVERTLQIRPFYAKQTQFSGLQNYVNSAYTKDYEEIRRKKVMKKQTQSCPPQADSNPILNIRFYITGAYFFVTPFAFTAFYI
jgi:hypothetical protein